MTTEVDEVYEYFIACYNTRKYSNAGNLIYNILCNLNAGQKPGPEWQEKLGRLLEFLAETGFHFDTPDTFYEMTAIIADKAKRFPNLDWKQILA